MSLRLSPAQSRVAALALLLALVGVLVGGVGWLTWSLHRHYDNSIKDSLDKLSRYGRVAAMRPDIEAAMSAVEKRDPAKYYWKASTPALVASEIQGAITRIIEGNGARIFSSQALPPTDDGKSAGPAAASISIHMSASIVPLEMILHAIESNEPYLFVDQLTIRANQGRTYRPIPGQQPDYIVQLTVRGLTRTETAKK